MSTVVKLSFEVTEELRQREFVETGQVQKAEREVEIELDTPQLREAWILLRGVGYTYYNLQTEDRVAGDWKYRLAPESKFEQIPTVTQLKQVLLARAEKFRQMTAKYKADKEAEDAERQRKQALAAPILAEINRLKEAGDMEALEAFRVPGELVEFCPNVPGMFNRSMYDWLKDVRAAVREQKASERAQIAEAQMGEWIKQHGSERLKRAFEGGYEVGRVYTLERAAKEAPGWQVDFYNQAEWKERTNPTLKELDAADAARTLLDMPVKIVWLTYPPKDYPNNPDRWGEDVETFEPGTAIVIQGYLGKYDLVKQL